MNSDGSEANRLTHGDSNSFAGPWSPDGQRIVFTGSGMTNSYIALINADGSDQTAGVYDLYIMNAPGSSITQMTNNEILVLSSRPQQARSASDLIGVIQEYSQSVQRRHK